MTGQDLMATAQTGTGKTAGFTLPILHRLASAPNLRASRRPRVLVLAPTRELAIQVEESVRTYGTHLPVNSLAVFGGVGINPQITALRRGVDILVATPGRLLDHVQQKTVDLGGIGILVLDEADRMLDMGWISTLCLMSLTSRFPTSLKTTCAAPAAPAWKARPSRWSATTNARN